MKLLKLFLCLDVHGLSRLFSLFTGDSGGGGDNYYANMDRLYGVQAQAAQYMLDQSMPYLPTYMSNSSQMVNQAMDGSLANQMRQQAANDTSGAIEAGIDAANRNSQRYGIGSSGNRLLSESNRNAIMGAATKADSMNKATTAAEEMKWNRNAGALAQATGMGSGAMSSIGSAASGYGSAANSISNTDAANASGYGKFGASLASSIFKDGGEVKGLTIEGTARRVKDGPGLAMGGDAWSAYKNQNPIQTSKMESESGSGLGAVMMGAAPSVVGKGVKYLSDASGLTDAVKSGTQTLRNAIGLGSEAGGTGISGGLESAGATGAMESSGGLGSGVSGSLAAGAGETAGGTAAATGMEAAGGLGSGISGGLSTAGLTGAAEAGAAGAAGAAGTAGAAGSAAGAASAGAAGALGAAATAMPYVAAVYGVGKLLKLWADGGEVEDDGVHLANGGLMNDVMRGPGTLTMHLLAKDTDDMNDRQQIASVAGDPLGAMFFSDGGASKQRMDHRPGGHVQGPGSGTSDSIPSWLSNGEVVENTDAVKLAGKDTLLAINQAGLNVREGKSTAEQGRQAIGLVMAKRGQELLKEDNSPGLHMAKGGCAKRGVKMAGGGFLGGNLGIALGSGVDEYNRQQQMQRQTAVQDQQLQLSKAQNERAQAQFDMLKTDAEEKKAKLKQSADVISGGLGALTGTKSDRVKYSLDHHMASAALNGQTVDVAETPAGATATFKDKDGNVLRTQDFTNEQIAYEPINIMYGKLAAIDPEHAKDFISRFMKPFDEQRAARTKQLARSEDFQDKVKLEDLRHKNAKELAGLRMEAPRNIFIPLSSEGSAGYSFNQTDGGFYGPDGKRVTDPAVLRRLSKIGQPKTEKVFWQDAGDGTKKPYVMNDDGTISEVPVVASKDKKYGDAIENTFGNNGGARDGKPSATVAVGGLKKSSIDITKPAERFSLVKDPLTGEYITPEEYKKKYREDPDGAFGGIKRFFR